MSALPVLEDTVPPAGGAGPLGFPGASLPPLLRRVLAEGLAFAPDGTRVPLHSNISLEEAELLYRVLRQVRPSRTLEIGLAQGISALAILQALEDNGTGRHWVLDPFQHRFGNVGLAMIGRAGLAGRLEFHARFAEDVIPALGPVEFAFIDASHLFDLTMTEFVLIDKKLAVGGVVGLHDLWMPSLQKVVRYALTNRSYEIAREWNGPAPPRPASLRRSIKRRLLRLLHGVPGKEGLFREELLRPWSSITEDNLVLLRKTGADERDWQFHRSF